MLNKFAMGANQCLQARSAMMFKPILAAGQRPIMGAYPMRQFRQVNNLHEIIYTA